MCGNGSRICLRDATIKGVVNEDEEVKFYVRHDGEHIGRYDTAEEHASVSMRDIHFVHKLSDTIYIAAVADPKFEAPDYILRAQITPFDT